MSLWKKVKSVKNMVTGGAAELDLEIISEPILGQHFTVLVKAVVKQDSLNAKAVYLKIRGNERIHAEGVEIEYEDGEREVERTVVNKNTVTFQETITINLDQPLSSDQSYEWEFDVFMSDELNGTYNGTHAWHNYQMLAGLDAPGNDPDTNWLDFEIY